MRAGAGALVLLLAALALAGYLYERNRTGNIYHPHARFVAQPSPTLPKNATRGFAWPIYGYTQNHTRFFPAAENVRPPFKRLWVRNEGGLLEFPPVIYGETLYQLPDDAELHAIDSRTGKVIWRRSLGRMSASTPAVDASTVYATVLDSGDPHMPGRVVALDSSDGAIRWSRPLPSRSESSPLLAGGRLYFGSEAGTVYCLDASSGDVVWTYHAPGAVKASPSLADGVLYFGDYSGHVQAISASTGKRLWISASEGALFGSGTFYSTAAVMYGRVFLGNTDGRIYAYDQRTGALDWAVQTGDYVYSSPAVTNAPGIGPTIYLGSYDGHFYAINARSGHISWHFDPGGKISGSPTIIGRIVYFSDLSYHRIYALGISTGRVVFEMGSGSFDPAVSDGKDVYLTGYSALYAMEPTS
jgi:outer membrane protein assembly factor BamB